MVDEEFPESVVSRVLGAPNGQKEQYLPVSGYVRCTRLIHAATGRTNLSASSKGRASIRPIAMQELFRMFGTVKTYSMN